MLLFKTGIMTQKNILKYLKLAVSFFIFAMFAPGRALPADPPVLTDVRPVKVFPLFCFADPACEDRITVDGCNVPNGCTNDCCPAGSDCAADPSLCRHTPICNDGNACTEDICELQGESTCENFIPRCKTRPVSTDDGDRCTQDSCDPASGVKHDPLPGINDNNACTEDKCDAATGNIAHTPLSTDDGDLCTIDSCDPATGVQHASVNVDDGDPCTIDKCDPAAGITHERIPNCPPPPCGNGALEPDKGEECDDGNTQEGDGCNGSCRKEICGNKVIDFGEECDDGNTDNEDSCANNCRLIPPPPALNLRCFSPGNEIADDDKILIFAGTHAKPSVVTLAVEPAETTATDSQKSQLLAQALANVATVELFQTAGPIVKIEGFDTSVAGGAVGGRTLVMKAQATLDAAPPVTFKFNSPIPAGEKDGIAELSFVIEAKRPSGRLRWSAEGKCLVALQVFGGGGCSLTP
jgi:cysteine-rich repeat protein